MITNQSGDKFIHICYFNETTNFLGKIHYIYTKGPNLLELAVVYENTRPSFSCVTLKWTYKIRSMVYQPNG